MFALKERLQPLLELQLKTL
jgi:hypothetical protein